VAAQSLLQKQYQLLTRQHLGALEGTLFAELTGLHFHIVWMPRQSSPARPPLPTACSVCCRLANSTPQSHCGACGPKHLELARRAGWHGHRFTCTMGVSNYWFPITVRGVLVGIAFVQALDKANRILRQHLRKQPLAVVASHHDGAARFLSRSEFDRAAHLLRMIAQSAETATLSVLRKTDLARIRQAVRAMQQEQDRLHKHINRLLPADHQLPSSPHPPPPPIVERMLEYVHQHHAEPITLRHCADTLGRNAAYLSDLFAQAVGLPFKAYLTELRLEKSKELLSDPDKNLSEVALAVGYASENRFRLAFKQLTGLSPKTWRATMRLAV
jgi:AraC-like DNA-binding protein